MTGLDAELSRIVERASEVAASIIAEEAAAVDRECRWPERGLRALLDAGLGGLVVPRAHGGLERGLHALVHVCEVVARECASTAMCFGMHHVAASVLAAKPTSRIVRGFLEPIAAGRHLTTLALSEPGTGAHFYLPQTRLVREEDRLRLEGRKSFVTNGGHADSYVASALEAEAGEAGLGTFSMVVLPKDTPGLSFHSRWAGFGMRGNASCELAFDGTVVDADLLVGEPGDQHWYVFHRVAPFFLAAMAGTYLGLAGRALYEATASVRGRTYEHSGSTAAGEPVLQHRVGTLWGRFQSARRLALWAAAEYDEGGADALPAVFALKAEVGEAAVDIANEAMTLAGGRAYRDGSVLQRVLRDARAAHVMSPTTDLLRVWAGRALLGQPVLGG